MIDSKVYGFYGGHGPNGPNDSTGNLSYYPPGFMKSDRQYARHFAGAPLSIPQLSWSYALFSYVLPTPMGEPGPGSGGGTVSCRTGFTFTDDTGAVHGFNNFPPCEGITDPLVTTIDDSLDGSFIRMDTTNLQDIIVTDRSGLQYHFSVDKPYPFRINDPIGNAFYLFDTSSALTISDTPNPVSTSRTITITDNDISYKDSLGQLKHITSTPHVADSSPVGVYMGVCISSDQNFFNASDQTNYFDLPSRYDLSFPTGDSYGFFYNGLSEIAKVAYPSGGYTRYDYQGVRGAYIDGNWNCSGDVRQIKDRYVCSNTSGTCSASEEAVTAYSPDMGTNAGRDANISMDVRDPLQNRTHYDFYHYKYATAGLNPVETDRYIYAGESSLLRHIHTDYYRDGNDPNNPLGPNALPKTITTTLLDVTPNQESRVEMSYWPITGLINPFAGQIGGTTDFLSANVRERKEYGFNGNVLRTTSQSWLSNDAGFHILDEMTGQVITDDTGFSSSRTWDRDTSGNVIDETRGGTATSDATTVYHRDSYGRITSIDDPVGGTTVYGYDNPWVDSACTPLLAAVPSAVTDAKGNKHTMMYNPCTNTVHTSRDANNQTTTYSYDAIGRTTGIIYPDTGGQQILLSTGGGTPTTITTLLGSGISASTRETHDGLGRTVLFENLITPTDTISTAKAYDLRGLVASVSNPYRSKTDPTFGVTMYAYDALGRRRYVCNPDNGKSSCTPGNSYQEISYAGTYTDLFDERRDHRRQFADALGRLAQMWEPDSSNNPVLETRYGYNALNGLTLVTQIGGGGESSRARSFTYDGKGQLLTASNPETGTICYGRWSGAKCVDGYDGNGNLLLKTDARGVTTNYSYDSINRLLSKRYTNDTSGTASSCYQYDSSSLAAAGGNLIGRLTNSWTQAGTCPVSPPGGMTVFARRSILSYDAMGRVLADQQCTRLTCGSNVSYTPTYDYDLAGNMIHHSNGIGTLNFTNCYDTANRLILVVAAATPCDTITSPPSANLFSSPAYNPAGGLTSALFGSGLHLNRAYDSRLRISSETDTGNVVPVAMPGSTTFTVTGTEQKH